jgi:hypothetical protein
MSLVATYVFCEDKKWYKNLSYRDPRGNWFVCFDDDEPVELVIKQEANLDPHNILHDLGILYSTIGSRISSGRLFNPKTLTFTKAYSYFVDCYGSQPFPTPRESDTYDSVHSEHPKKGGVYYGGEYK